MLHEVNRTRATPLVLAAAVTAIALWVYASQPRTAARGAALVPIRDGTTIDFSGGSASVRDSAADRAALDAAVKDMDAASKDVTFPATPPKK
jgi:hypothetical protein